jgi:hypothetical protein
MTSNQTSSNLVQRHPDEADQEDRRDYVGDREVVPLVPDEVADSGATHEHLGCDDDEPRDADRDAEAGHDGGGRSRENDTQHHAPLAHF